MKNNKIIIAFGILAFFITGCNVGTTTNPLNDNTSFVRTQIINLDSNIITQSLEEPLWGNFITVNPINFLLNVDSHFLVWGNGGNISNTSKDFFNCGHGNNIVSTVNAGNGFWAYEDSSNNIYPLKSFTCIDPTINAGTLSRQPLAADGAGNIFYAANTLSKIKIVKSPITKLNTVSNSWTLTEGGNPLFIDLDSSGNLLVSAADKNNTKQTDLYFASQQNKLKYITDLQESVKQVALLNIKANSTFNSEVFWIGESGSVLNYFNIGAQITSMPIHSIELNVGSGENVTSFEINDSLNRIYLGTNKGNIFSIPYMAVSTSFGLSDFQLQIDNNKSIIKYLTNDNKASINVIKYDSFLDQVLIGANNGNIYTIHYKEYNATSLTNDLPASNNTCKKISSQKFGVVENCLYNANGIYSIHAQPWAKYMSVFAYGAGGGGGDHNSWRGGAGGNGYKINLVNYSVPIDGAFSIVVGGGGLAGDGTGGGGGGYSAVYANVESGTYLLIAGGGGGGGFGGGAYGNGSWGLSGGSATGSFGGSSGTGGANGGGNGFGASGKFDLSKFPSPAGGSGASNAPNPSEDDRHYFTSGGFNGGGSSLRYVHSNANVGGGGGYGGGYGGIGNSGGGAGGSYIMPNQATSSIFNGSANNGGNPSIGSSNSTNGNDGYVLIKFSQEPLYY